MYMYGKSYNKRIGGHWWSQIHVDLYAENIIDNGSPIDYALNRNFGSGLHNREEMEHFTPMCSLDVVVRKLALTVGYELMIPDNNSLLSDETGSIDEQCLKYI